MQLIRNIYCYCIIIIAGLLPSGIYGLTLAFVAIAGLCQIILSRRHLPEGLRNKIWLQLSVLLYIIIVIGFFFANNFREGLSSLSVYLPFLLYPLFFSHAGNIDEKLLHKANKVFLYTTCIFLGAAIVYAIYDSIITGTDSIMIDEGIYKKYHSAGLTRIFDNWHPTYVSMFANHSLFLAIRLFLKNRKEKAAVKSGMHLLLIIFLCLCIYLLNSLTGIIICLIILIYYIMKWMIDKIDNKTGVITVTGLLALGAFLFLYINPLEIEKVESLKNRDLELTDNYKKRNLLTMRLAKWDVHLNIIRDHVIFGTTLGDIKDVRQNMYLRNNYQDLALHNYNAHNEFLEIWATLGTIGLLVFLAMLITPLIAIRSEVLYLFLLLIIITSLTESILQRQQGLNYFMFFFVLYTLYPSGRRIKPR